MALVDQSVAIQTAEENTALRLRMKRAEEDEQRENNNRTYEALDTTSADNMRSKNNALRDEIAELQHELDELRTVNVTDLHHQYQRLDGRRAYLHNENSSLRSVLANQRRSVRRATNNVNAYQEVRRQSEEQNAVAKSDIKMFKERREALQEETQKLARKEARLQNELATMPVSSEELESERRRLSDDNAKKAMQITELELLVDELKAEEAQKQNEEVHQASTTSSVDIVDLRREYIALKEEMKELK